MKKLLIAALVAASVTGSAFGFMYQAFGDAMDRDINKTNKKTVAGVSKTLEKVSSRLVILGDAHADQGNKKTATQTKKAVNAVKKAQDATNKIVTVHAKETGTNLE